MLGPPTKCEGGCGQSVDRRHHRHRRQRHCPLALHSGHGTDDLGDFGPGRFLHDGLAPEPPAALVALAAGTATGLHPTVGPEGAQSASGEAERQRAAPELALQIGYQPAAQHHHQPRGNMDRYCRVSWESPHSSKGSKYGSSAKPRLRKEAEYLTR